MNTREPHERGVAVVEAAIVIPLFVVLLLTFIDFARYYAAQALLTKGAVDAANRAARIADYDIDIASLAPSDDKSTRYLAAKTAVVGTASSLATMMMVGTHTSSSLTKLKPFTRHEYFANGLSHTAVGDAMVLRPGESIQKADGTWFHHPSRCAPSAPGCSTPRAGFEPMEQLLRDYPIYVQLEGELRTFSPILSRTLPLRVTTLAWREQAAKSGFKEGAAAPTTATQLPTPIPVDEDWEDDVCEGDTPPTAGQCEALGQCLGDSGCACGPCGGSGA